MTPSSAQLVEAPARASRITQMRAAVYRGAGRVEVESVARPEIGPGELLIRVAACGICGTDIKKIQYGFVDPPQVFGHEIAGTVVEVGAGMRKFKAGDRVVSFHHIPCGSCFYCERKLFSQCATYKKVGVTAGFTPNGGGFAEYVRVMSWVAERGVVAIPPAVSFLEATFVEPVNTCLKAVEKARVVRGETVVVMGQGPIGVLLMLLAQLRGATVIVTDPMPQRRARSEQLGAVALDPAAGSVEAEVLARTSNRGADAVLVAVPSPQIVPEALALARPGGRVLLFAHNDPQMQLQFPAAAVGVEEKEILGSYSAGVDLQEESARLVFERRLPLGELISHTFPLEQFTEALELAARPSADSFKVVITP